MSGKVTEAQEALDAWDEAHQIGATDPGMQSMRFHESQAKRTKDLRTYLNKLGRESRERERLVENLERAKRAERIATLPTEAVDPSTLKGASAILIVSHGRAEWHRVVRVNKTTVTCWAPPGFDQPRYGHERIVGVHHAEAEAAS